MDWASFESFAEKFAKEPIPPIDSQMYRFVIFYVEGQSGKLGFDWAAIDYDYINGYIDYFRKLRCLNV